MNVESSLIIKDNAFVSCHLAGIYVQGTNSKPSILQNVFMVCKNSSIVINEGVEALIGLNEMQINELPIELINNNSFVFENTL